MLLSLLKIGLLSLFAFNIPSTLLADSSKSMVHTANNEVVFKQENKKESYYIERDIRIGDYKYYRFLPTDSLPYVSNKNDLINNYYFNFGVDDSFFILGQILTNSYNQIDNKITQVDIYYSDTEFSIRCWNPFSQGNTSILTYTFSTHEYTFNSILGSTIVLAIPLDVVLADNDNTSFDNFFKFFDGNNGSVDLESNWRYGLMIGSDNFIRADDSGDHAVNYYNGTYRLNLMNYFPDAYRATSGLYWYNGKFYTNLVYNLYYLPTGTKVMSDNGQPMTLTTNQVMVGAIALANGTTAEYTNYLSDYQILLAADFTIYDNSEYATGHYTKYASSFISIGSEIYDVEYINLANTDYNFYTFLNNIRGHYDYPHYVAPVDVKADYDPTDTLTASFSLIKYTLTNLTSFFGIELIKGITIGALILIPFAITLLLFVVKLFKR